MKSIPYKTDQNHPVIIAYKKDIEEGAKLMPKIQMLLAEARRQGRREAAEEWAEWNKGLDSVPWDEDIDERLAKYE